MEIKDLRNILKMSQREFANNFGIPLGTLRNWEQKISHPPEYVSEMILATLRRDKMINVETIKFIKLMDELAQLTLNGIEPFEKADEENFGSKIFYDAKTEIARYDAKEYKIVWDACIDMCHHDIISYYDNSNEYTIRAVVTEDDGVYLLVSLILSEAEIIIEKGAWYFI